MYIDDKPTNRLIMSHFGGGATWAETNRAHPNRSDVHKKKIYVASNS